MIYHLLHEPFSAFTGLGIASVVANLMRNDDGSMVVCDEADDTFGLAASRVLLIPPMSVLPKPIGWRYFPRAVNETIIRRIFAPLSARLQPRDIVWCHNGPYSAAAIEQTVHSKGARLIYHSHNSLSHYQRRPVLKSFTADALIFNSDAMRQEALTFLPGLANTHVVHNGTNEALFFPAREEDAPHNAVPVILFVGRLVPYKGVHVLTEAMKILHELDVKALCKVVGSSHAGGPKNKTTPYIKDLVSKAPPNVEFIGFRKGLDLADQYRAADILCCPSIWQEPFGTVNVEAMACRVPVVASRVGGIPEIASGGGIVLVEPGDATELADALQELILDQDLRVKMGITGRASFEQRFTWASIMGQYREIIAAL